MLNFPLYGVYRSFVINFSTTVCTSVPYAIPKTYLARKIKQPALHIQTIVQGSHSDWKNGKAFSSHGILNKLEKSGNNTRYWKSPGISDKYYLLFFGDIVINCVFSAKIDQVLSLKKQNLKILEK